MKLVIVESPYAGDIERNVKYAKRAMRDCIERGEAPFASHMMYTLVLDDGIPYERMYGITLGYQWAAKADATVVYTDYGTSQGMADGIADAVKAGREIEYRSIGKNEETKGDN